MAPSNLATVSPLPLQDGVSLGAHARMLLVMRKIKGVAKSERNSQGNYQYAGHEAVTAALREAYVEFGLVRTADVEDIEIVGSGAVLMKVRVTWTCADNPNNFVSVMVPGLQSSVKKDGGLSPVQIGMALSYAVKNAEFKAFSLTGDDTPDSEELDRDRGRIELQDIGNDKADNMAVEILARYKVAKTVDEWEEISAYAKTHWDLVKNVPGFAEQLVQGRRAAKARLEGR